MDDKEYLTNKAFCPVPWTGLMYNFDGNIKTCIRSSDIIGNIQDNTIVDILVGEKNTDTQTKMLNKQPGSRCNPCYKLETHTNSFNIISDRVFYLKELKTINKELYDTVGNFDLQTIDVRWSNQCNFACIYCGPEFSSKWSNELNIVHTVPSDEKRTNFKNYIFENASQLKHVYLAGGEPLLMKENLELLQLLKEVNPLVNLRINTNLSKVDTKIFNLICTFPNVHWIVSVESIEEEFEYIRYGSKWKDFLENLLIIKQLDHKISFNMLHFLLNYNSLFGCIEFLQQLGFHPNSFIIGALLQPDFLDIRHLPNKMLVTVQQTIQHWLDKKYGFLLDNGLNNVLSYIKNPINADIDNCLLEIYQIDKRRNINSKVVFTEFYDRISQ
jgi:sulfatase maturation enzyme AslB (radical SAM superfamily)